MTSPGPVGRGAHGGMRMRWSWTMRLRGAIVCRFIPAAGRRSPGQAAGSMVTQPARVLAVMACGDAALRVTPTWALPALTSVVTL